MLTQKYENDNLKLKTFELIKILTKKLFSIINIYKSGLHFYLRKSNNLQFVGHFSTKLDPFF